MNEQEIQREYFRRSEAALVALALSKATGREWRVTESECISGELWRRVEPTD